MGTQVLESGEVIRVPAQPIKTYSGTLTAGGPEAVLVSIPIPESTTYQLSVDWDLYNDTQSAEGPMGLIVRRKGSAAPAIVSQPGGSLGSIFHADVSAWNPIAAISGNNLILKATPDAYSDYNVELTVNVVKKTNTSGAPPALTLAAARARTLAVQGLVLELWAAAGLTPATPTPGDNVTAIADQTTNGHNGTGTAGHYLTYQVDSAGEPYLQGAGGASDQWFTLGGGSLGPQTDHVFRWTVDHDTNATPSADVLFTSTTGGAAPQFWIASHMGATVGSNGTNWALYDNAGFHVLYACPSGMHDYELRLKSDGTWKFYIDGVLVSSGIWTPIAMRATNVLGALGTNYGFPGKIYAFEVKGSLLADDAADDLDMENWRQLRALTRASYAT